MKNIDVLFLSFPRYWKKDEWGRQYCVLKSKTNSLVTGVVYAHEPLKVFYVHDGKTTGTPQKYLAAIYLTIEELCEKWEVID